MFIAILTYSNYNKLIHCMHDEGLQVAGRAVATVCSTSTRQPRGSAYFKLVMNEKLVLHSQMCLPRLRTAVQHRIRHDITPHVAYRGCGYRDELCSNDTVVSLCVIETKRCCRDTTEGLILSTRNARDMST